MDITPIPQRVDVAVVGGGLAGLAAARLIRDAGRSTVVLDAHPGGRARTDVRDGFRFNRGPHALYLGGPAHSVLERLGVHPSGRAPAGRAYGSLAGEVHELPAGPRALLRSPLLGWRGRAAIARLLTQLPKIDTAALAGRSFTEWLDAGRLPSDARALIEMLARVSSYSHAPDVAAADLVVRQLQLAMTSGVLYADGGWSTMVDQLRAGIDLCEHQVVSVGRDAGDVVVELTGGDTIRAGAAIVATGTPAAAAAVIGRRAFDVGPAIEADCLDLGTPSPSPTALLFGIDQPLYLSDHGAAASGLAPGGGSVVHVARYLAPGERRDPGESRAELERHAGLAGIDVDTVLTARFLPHMTVAGSLPLAAHGGLAGRPGVTASGVDGVLLAGDWVGPEGHLLDASLASAAAAATAALDAATLVRR